MFLIVPNWTPPRVPNDTIQYSIPEGGVIKFQLKNMFNCWKEITKKPFSKSPLHKVHFLILSSILNFHFFVSTVNFNWKNIISLEFKKIDCFLDIRIQPNFCQLFRWKTVNQPFPLWNIYLEIFITYLKLL